MQGMVKTRFCFYICEAKPIMKYIIPALALTFVMTSCKKEYTCVCTNSNTGSVSRGDVIKTGPLTHETWKRDCEQNDELSGGSLKDCHLEEA
jgi:hypothetical protein